MKKASFFNHRSPLSVFKGHTCYDYTVMHFHKNKSFFFDNCLNQNNLNNSVVLLNFTYYLIIFCNSKAFSKIEKTCTLILATFLSLEKNLWKSTMMEVVLPLAKAYYASKLDFTTFWRSLSFVPPAWGSCARLALDKTFNRASRSSTPYDVSCKSCSLDDAK